MAFTGNAQSYQRTISVVDLTKPLRVTLAYTDAPATGSAPTAPALVNNLNLEVVEILAGGVEGQTYLGNVFDPATGFSVVGGVADDLNNVECVYIQNPVSRYRLRIWATSIVSDARPPFSPSSPWQDFAYVIDNAVREADNPVSVVPVLDRSGSMVVYGYEAITRTTTKNFIDLLSVNDSLGVVSFSSIASKDFTDNGNPPHLVMLNDIASKNGAIAAVDGIVFGGCTYMGDGIAKAGELLTTASNEKAIVLLSDGYDNQGCDQGNPAKPTALQATAALTEDVVVYTCAMGAAADHALLQQLATDTGGRYYNMPAIEQLPEIYNYIRGQITDGDESIITNTSAFASRARVKSFVEKGARTITFSVTWLREELKYVESDPTKSSQIAVRLIGPNGKRVHPRSSVMQTTVGGGYVIFRVAEPAPGIWSIEVETQRRDHTRFTVCCFVNSDIRLRIPFMPQSTEGVPVFNLPMQVLLGGGPISDVSAQVQVTVPSGNIADVMRKYRDRLSRIDVSRDKDTNAKIAKLLMLQREVWETEHRDIFVDRFTNASVLAFDSLRQRVGGKTIADLLKLGDQRMPKLLEGRLLNTLIAISNRGTYNVEVNLTGYAKERDTRFVRKDLFCVLAR